MGWTREAPAILLGLFMMLCGAAVLAGDEVPAGLPGAQTVDARQARELAREARYIDTRVLHDFLAGHLPGALHVHYRERSGRTPAFDAAQDDVPGFLGRLRKYVPQRTTPLVFYCNGVSCWKSYKGARAALGDGYRRVYWLRGGLAEWQGQDYEVVSE